MKVLGLVRDETGDEGTFSVGILLENGEQLGSWHFVELPWRENQPGVSCVPEGRYAASVVKSQHFDRDVYLLRDIPGRDAVEIHVANFGGDVSLGYHSDLRGCMGPGLGRGDLIPARSTMKQRAVLGSELALNQILEATAGEDIVVAIAWDPSLRSS